MKQFFKFIFASCLGTIIALSAIILIIFIIGAASAPKQDIPKNSVLHLKLDHVVPELTDNVAQDNFMSFETVKATGVNDIKRLIRLAANDPKILGLFIQTEMPGVAPSTAFELCSVLDEFKESGKPIIAYGDYFTQSGYVLASNADSIFLNPNGLVDARGYGMTIPYMEGFAKKTNIKFDVYFAGKYKSAIEPFYRNEMSEENRYQSRIFLNNFQQKLTEIVAANRNIDAQELNHRIVKGLLINGDDALEAGLVDKLDYYDSVKDRFAEVLDLTELKLVDIHEYLLANPKSSTDHKNKIAVIYAEGTVAFSDKSRGNINMEVYEEILERIKKNKKIKAVVLRVNSPGGSAFTSDVFWKKMEDIKAAGKPIIASFGDYAASGGYYIAAGADHIISEPTTLTGSIGVFAMMPNFDDFFQNKIGINWDTIGTGEATFIYSNMVKRSSSDYRILQSETDRAYHQFKSVVAKGRNMTLEQTDAVAQGRVWSGIDALEVGLIDQIGSLDDAIEVAATRAEIDDYKIIEYPIIKKSFFETFFESIIDEASKSDIKALAGKSYTKYTAQLEKFLAGIVEACDTPQARLPFMIETN